MPPHESLAPNRPAGRRLRALAIAVGIALLLASFGVKGFLTWRGSRNAGTAATDARPEAPAVTPGENADSSKPAVAAIDRDLDLHGIVVTETGTPVEGALLSTVTFPWRRANLLDCEFSDLEIKGPATRSAADGTFAIRLRRAEVVTLRVAADGFAGFDISKCQAGERLRVVVHPGVRLVVRAIDEAGAPIQGARIKLSDEDIRDELNYDRLGETAADGACTLEGLPPSRKSRVEAAHHDFGLSDRLSVVLPREGEMRVDFPMTRGRQVAGVVTDAVGGKPIAGARVGIGLTFQGPVVTDSEGRFCILHWTWHYGDDLYADADGYGMDVAVVADRSEVNFALVSGDSVTGRVVTAAGIPVPGARVSAFAAEDRDDAEVYSHREGVSAADGRFFLRGLRRDLPHSLVAMADGYGRVLLDFNPRPEEAGVVDLGDIVLPVGRVIEGRVLAASGDPVARNKVRLHGENSDSGRLRPEGPPIADDYYGRTESLVSDDLGRFRFRDLAPGDYLLIARENGNPDVELRVKLAAEADLTGVEIRLREYDVVRVLVTDNRGQPLENIVVSANSGSLGAVRTAADGRANLRISIPEVTVMVYRADEGQMLAPEPQPSGPGMRDLTFVLEETGAATGEVVDPDGKVVPGAQIIVYGPAFKVLWMCQADQEGRFDAQFPLLGPVDLVLTGTVFVYEGKSSGYRDSLIEGRLDRVIAGSTGLRLVARPIATDRSIVVRVEDPDGRAVADIQVTANRNGKAVASAQTDVLGRATLSALPSSGVRLYATPDPASDWRYAALSAVPDGQEVVLKFRHGAVVEGIILGPDGEAVAGAEVSVMISGAKICLWREVSGADGRFRTVLDPDESRPIELRAKLEDRLSGSLGAVRPGGGPVTLRMERK